MPAGRKRRSTPPASFWVKAILIGGVTALVSGAAGFLALAGVARSSNPQLVSRLPVNDPLAMVYLAEKRVRRNPKSIKSDEVRSAATVSLRREPLNPLALRLLALHFSTRGEHRHSEALARMSERLSRRDLLTQIMLIEDAVRRNRVAEALVHYDRALRTKSSSGELLFPILKSAMELPAIRTELSKYLEAPWAEGFLRHAIEMGSPPETVIDLFRLAPKGVGKARLAELFAGDIIGRLIATKNFDAARQFYLSDPSANPALLQATSFTSDSTNQKYAPIAWQTLESPAIGVGFERLTPTSQLLRVSAGTGESGPVLRKILFLKPGRAYQLVDDVQKIVWSDTSANQWKIICATSGANLWNGTASKANAFFIPPGCESQLLELLVVAGDDQRGVEMTVKAVELRPLASSQN